MADNDKLQRDMTDEDNENIQEMFSKEKDTSE